MNAKAAVLLLAFALVACGEKNAGPSAAQEPAKPETARVLETDRDSDNLLNLAFGASVVSRTGEVSLDSSAAHAIDGMVSTYWSSSPGWPSETLVYSLLAPSRISRVGVTPVDGDEIPQRVRFEGSLDGRTWTELGIVQPEKSDSRQLLSITPAVAQYIRVSVLEQQTYYAHARGLHAIGDEVRPPTTPPFTGCWELNGMRAHLRQDRARVSGMIEAKPPIHLDGGTDNRVAMLQWTQGPVWGYAVLTRTPDGQHVTGLRFYNEAMTEQVGEAWMGERCKQIAMSLAPPPIPSRSAPHVSIFGLVFDDRGGVIEELSAPELSRIRALAPRRLIVHEFAFDDHAANLARAKAKAAGLRAALRDLPNVEIVANGSAARGPQTSSGVQRLLATRVDIIPPP